MRATSAAALRAITDNGYLEGARRDVYVFLYHHGPLSCAALDEMMGSPHAHKRISELVQAGVVAEYDETVNPQSGQRNVRFDVTSKVLASKYVPPKPAKKPSATTQRKLAARFRHFSFVSGTIIEPDLEEALRWMETR